MKKLRNAVTAALAMVFIFGVGMIFWNLLQYSAGHQAQEKALQVAMHATVPEPTLSETISVSEQTTLEYAENPQQLLRRFG